MVHRSVLGSLERLIAHLTEVHAGAFPAWMAPVQVAVLPVGDEQIPAADALTHRMVVDGLRAELSPPDRGTLSARIRHHRLVPYLAILGAQEAADDTVSLRLRDGTRLDPLPTTRALNRISDGIEARGRELSPPARQAGRLGEISRVPE